MSISHLEIHSCRGKATFPRVKVYGNVFVRYTKTKAMEAIASVKI